MVHQIRVVLLPFRVVTISLPGLWVWQDPQLLAVCATIVKCIVPEHELQ